MIVAAKIKLADARAQLGMSQTTLAAAAGISKPVIVNAEKGLPIRRLSAFAMLEALNNRREARGWPSLSVYDIEWHIE